jgi:hypothetical protein
VPVAPALAVVLVEHGVPPVVPVLVAVLVVLAVPASAAVQAEVPAGRVERAALPAADQVWVVMPPAPVVRGDPSLQAGLLVPASKRGLPVPADPEVPAVRALMASVVRVFRGVLSDQALKVVLSDRVVPAVQAVPVS